MLEPGTLIVLDCEEDAPASTHPLALVLVALRKEVMNSRFGGGSAGDSPGSLAKARASIERVWVGLGALQGMVAMSAGMGDTPSLAARAAVRSSERAQEL